MEKAKHTPGPWKAIKAAFRDENQEEDRLIISEEDHHVAEVFQYRQDEHHDADGTALANAALIAKAPLIPELVEELKRALDEICRLCVLLNPQHETCQSCEDMEAMRRIIAKAESK